MSEDQNAEGTAAGSNLRLLGILTVAGLGALLLVSVMSLILIIGLMNQLAAVDDQARKAAKANKALQEEVAAIRATLGAPQPVALSAQAPAELKPTNIDAADPANDCVVRSDDKRGVSKCMAIGIDLKGRVK